MRMPFPHINSESVDPLVVKATMDLAQVDRTVILDPEVWGQKTVDAPFVMKSLRGGDAVRKWQRRQNEDPEIKKIIQLIKDDEWIKLQI